MIDKFIQEIKDVENEADKILSDAIAENEALLFACSEQIENLRKSYEEKFKTHSQEMGEQIRAQADEEERLILVEAKVVAEKIINNAEKKIKIEADKITADILNSLKQGA